MIGSRAVKINKVSNRAARAAAAAIAALTIGGCAMTPAQKAPVIAQPKARAVQNITSFSQSLRCMDELFLAFGVRDVVITSQGIPDATGEIKTGTKEMMISSVSKMSVRSGAFRFVDYDQTQFDINALQQLVGFTDDFLVPNYYIRGAITQLDEQVLSESAGGALQIKTFGIGASKDQVLSVVSVDLNVGNLLTRQIIAGTSANNSIAVRRSGQALDGNAQIEKIELGLSFNVSMNRSEGMHQSIRTLVDLSMIETLGKLSQVPYWRCLGIQQTNPSMVAQARSWFEDMSAEEQVTFVQRALHGKGLYDGPLDGKSGPVLREAVGVYQASQGLLADGRIDFDLYASLISEDLALGRAPAKDVVPQPFKPQTKPARRLLGLTLTTEKGRQPTYQVGDKLSFTLQTSGDAFAYCYYQDSASKVARVFPNRFQPNALVAGGAPIKVPGPGAQFEILLEQPAAHEDVLCVASDVELGMELPESLKAQDLTPLEVRSLNDVVRAFRDLGKGQVVEARLPVRVTR